MRYKPATSKKTVIFLHIPKTAGTTLDQIIYRHYRYRDVFETGVVSQDGVTAYQNMSEEKRAKYRLLKGHMNYGIHQYVPGPYAYFTFLREPVDRTISHFYYIQKSANHPLYNLIQEGGMDIKAYLEQRLDPMLFNAHTRILSGIWDILPAGQCTEEHLEMAKDHLKNHIQVIGLTERFDESLLLLGKAFGWHHLYYKRLNVAKERPKKDSLPPESMTAIEQANALDLSLYEYGQTLFEAQLHQLGPSVPDVIRKFRFQNRFVSPLSGLYWEMRKVSVRVFIQKQLDRFRKTAVD